MHMQRQLKYDIQNISSMSYVYKIYSYLTNLAKALPAKPEAT